MDRHRSSRIHAAARKSHAIMLISAAKRPLTPEIRMITCVFFDHRNGRC
jgi:hypothetical protein